MFCELNGENLPISDRVAVGNEAGAEGRQVYSIVMHKCRLAAYFLWGLEDYGWSLSIVMGL
ncbi:hypothetical protein QW71_16790 [Paenibacillus sp. IHB B 3415]|nr:hypothetical protein QW71_16790 [Paenibacillus sp. IHB B 3415]